MKRYLRKLLTLAFIPLMLASCKDDVSEVNNENTNNDVTENQNENNNDENNSNEENNNGNNEENNTPKKVEVGDIYKSTTWDETIDDMAKTVVGDMYNKIPKFIAPSYEAYMEYATDQGEEFLVFTIMCFGVNVSSADVLYVEAMEKEGFTIYGSQGYGALMKDYESDLFVSYGYVDIDVEDYFEIKAVVRYTRQLNWDSQFVNLYAGMEVPVCPAKAYNNLYDNFNYKVIIYALFVEDNAMDKYVDILRKAGYTYDSTVSTTESVVYYDPTGYVSIQIYETYGEYEKPALYIEINNKWPTVLIMAFNGIMDFPKLESDNAAYDKWTLIDPVGEANEKDYVLSIYYVNASNADFDNYVGELVDNCGFVTSSHGVTTSNIYYADLVLDKDKVYAEVSVMYNAPSNEICIAIYQNLSEGE
ncbi:MAG: hypothetical protein K6E21_01165 [Bacilli bacterium]|nr:hypothetical protein [Bacilli bacterium]